jgi:NAD(P)-dependent dehydrogenase (short-subunit alcohol dehydrogenase family)
MTEVKDVVVTGVSTGIGLETTRLLISNGYRVFGSVRKQTDADRLQKEIGDRYVPLIMDVTDADAVQRASEKVGALLGSNRLAGLVNNAGIVVSGPLLHLRPSQLRRQLEANVIGPLMVTQAFAPLLGTDNKRTGPVGRIVNVSSTVAKIVPPLLGAYAASKWGLEGMSEALRRELMLFGIDLVIIEPGAVNTALYDKGENEDLSEFKPTPYWDVIENFRKYVVNEGRKGLPPARLAKTIYVALTTATPKTRYAVVPQSFKNWTLPRLFPTRMVDDAIAKQMGLIKK